METVRRYSMIFSKNYPAALQNYELLKSAPPRQSPSLLRGLVLLGVKELNSESATVSPSLNSELAVQDGE